MDLYLSISSEFVGGMRQFVAQILSMDAIFLGYWVAGQVKTMISSVMYNSKFIMGYMPLSRVLIISFEMFFRDNLRNTRIVYLLGNVMSRVDGLGDSL